MQVTGATGALPESSLGGSTGTGAAASPPGGRLGEKAFLQLLVAQLQYQDPLQPVSSTSFITQLAQFEMLAVLQHIQGELQSVLLARGGGSSAGSIPGGGSSGGGG